MSEYQYFEFRALDRPLSEADQKALRALSTRARITATGFTNHYEWGDFKGDPRQLMERWFDLHLYLTNWGTRRLMMRLPKRLVERARLDGLFDVDWLDVWENGENLIVDMSRDDIEPGYDDWDDGSGWLGVLAPLRDDVLSGDLRLFHLLWLMALEDGMLEDDACEPLAGIGPLTGGLQAAADFFVMDPDLVQAAAERADGPDPTLSADVVRATIAGLSDAEKADHLVRVVEGAPHVASELKQRMRTGHAGPVVAPRTVGALTARAAEIRSERERIEAERLAEEKRRREKEAKRARRKRLYELRQRGDAVWQEIETDIVQRNASGYDRAAALLSDLKAIATEDGTTAEFVRRLDAIRDRHARKGRFLERLQDLDAR